MDAEFQAITWMCQTAHFAVWKRLLRTDSRGSLSTPSESVVGFLFRKLVRFRDGPTYRDGIISGNAEMIVGVAG